MATYPPSVPKPNKRFDEVNLFCLAFPVTKKDFSASPVALRRVEPFLHILKLRALLIFVEFYVFASLKNIFNNVKKIFADFALNSSKR